MHVHFCAKYADESHYRELRAKCVQYMRENEPDFAPFIEDNKSFNSYVTEMSRCGVWGGNLELQALSMVLGVNIRIHQLQGSPSYDIRNFSHRKAPVIHLSYHRNEHYASVRPLADAHSTGPAGHQPLPRSDTPTSSEISLCTSIASSTDPEPAAVETKSPFLSDVFKRVRILSSELQLLEARLDGILWEDENESLRNMNAVKARKLWAKAQELRECATDFEDDLELVKNRATRIDIIASEDPDLEYDKRLHRSRKRVLIILDDIFCRFDHFKMNVEATIFEGCAHAFKNSADEVRQAVDPRKRVSKKKTQETKKLERSARRRREQERQAQTTHAQGKGDDKLIGTAFRDIAI